MQIFVDSSRNSAVSVTIDYVGRHLRRFPDGNSVIGVSVDGTGNRVLVQGDGTTAGDPNNGRLFVYEARTGQQQWTLRLGKGRALVGNVVLEDDVLLRDGFEP